MCDPVVTLRSFLLVLQGFCISFLTQLDRASHNVVETLLQKNLLAHVNASSIVHQILQKPGIENEKFLNFEGYWICQGKLEPCQSSDYVFTSTVKDNLKCLARIVSGRFVELYSRVVCLVVKSFGCQSIFMKHKTIDTPIDTLLTIFGVSIVLFSSMLIVL